MTRRNQRRNNQKPREQRYRDNDQALVQKLDLRKLAYFKYDSKELFNSTDMDPKVWNPLLASIVTKASRMSIKEAKEYIRGLEDDEVLTKETGKALSRILDRYKKWR